MKSAIAAGLLAALSPIYAHGQECRLDRIAAFQPPCVQPSRGPSSAKFEEFIKRTSIFHKDRARRILADEVEKPLDEIPRFDVNAACEGFASNSCIKAEQESYDVLKLLWPQASALTRRICLDMMISVTPASEGSSGSVSEAWLRPYENLNTCTVQYLNQEDHFAAAKPFKF